MRIVFLAPEAFPVPPIRGGSVEHCVDRLSRFIARRHQVAVVGRSDHDLPRRNREDRVEHRRVDPRLSGGYLRGYLRGALRELSGLKFDLLQVDNRPVFLPVLRKLFPKRILVLALHSMNFLVPPLLGPSRASDAVKAADAIAVNSEFVRRSLIQAFPEAAGRVWVVRPGVDIELFPSRRSPRGLLIRHEARNKLGLGSRPVVFFAGRIIPRKGLHTLIRAMALVRRQVPEAVLMVAGRRKSFRTGKIKPYPARLAHLASSLKVPVKWLGFIPPGRIAQFYAAADLGACPSEKDEALGLINLEAMACGLPVVASRIGGIPEAVVDGETGFLVDDYTNPEALAGPIIEVLSRPVLAQEMGLRGRRVVEDHFSWERVGEEMERVYRYLHSNR